MFLALLHLDIHLLKLKTAKFVVDRYCSYEKYSAFVIRVFVMHMK